MEEHIEEAENTEETVEKEEQDRPTAKMIFKNSGEPFASRRAAATQQTILKKEGVITKLIEVADDKWALEVLKENRKKRAKLGVRSVWDPKKDKNFEYRGVNDDPNKPGRIEMFQRAGWEVVKGSDPAADNRAGITSSPGSSVSVPGGNGITMVLMRKRKDWFDEDVAEKQAEIDQSEQMLTNKARMDNLQPAEGYQQGIDIRNQ